MPELEVGECTRRQDGSAEAALAGTQAGPPKPSSPLRDRILGVDQLVPLLDGSLVPYVNLDNAASTPPLLDVMEALERFLPYYSSVHRGSGFKSRLSTTAYEQAHDIIGCFVGADLDSNTVIFGKNTTEAINKLSYRLPLVADEVIITTRLEHHSNDLPWRRRARVVHVRTTPEGRLDEEDFDRQLTKYAGRVRLVAVTGASNVTGFLPPIHRLAWKAHAAGARILVDAAQLAPHRPLDMRPDDDPEHLDFVVLAGHKIYAPFGTGALIGPKEVFLHDGPEYTGGGTISVVTLDEVHWASLPHREESGSPNVVGAVAMAAAVKALMKVGMNAIVRHEADLTRYTLEQLATIPGVEVYGDAEPDGVTERIGAIPFNLRGVPHSLVAAILGYEGGIGVRSGRFCAQAYVAHLLGTSHDEAAAERERVLSGDSSNVSGMVRISFGCYNNRDDVDRLIDMLQRVAHGESQGEYSPRPSTGEFIPAGYVEPLAQHFSLESFG